MTKIDAILPAGGRLDDAFAKVVGASNKALVPFDGITILDRTLSALRESSAVGRIVLIGSRDVNASPEASKADAALPEGATGPENIFRGLDYLMDSGEPPQRVLICASDLPFLTADVVSRFVASCPEEIDFCVPLIEEEAFADAFPQAKATFVELRDGVYTTGCLYNVRPEPLRKAIHAIDHLFMNRKSKLGMARLLGWRFTLQLLSKRLAVRDIEGKVRELLGCTGAAVPHSPPELAYDIDYVEDYHYAVQAFRTMRRVPVMH
jgi:molybdopterin-guanine dinucleotide biosynthesis protein A